MALEQLRHLKGLLDGSLGVEAGKIRMGKKDRILLARRRDRMAMNLHKELGILQKIMKHETIGGKLNLGTKVEEVNWALMPESVAKCFKPEFDYQPEEITEFYVEYSDHGAEGERSVGIHLSRNRLWWSYVQAGSLVRRKGGPLSGLECMGSAYMSCRASEAQPKAAREAMSELNQSLWLDSSGRSPEGKELPYIINDINEFRLGEDILNFVMAEIQNRIQSSQMGEGPKR